MAADDDPIILRWPPAQPSCTVPSEIQACHSKASSARKSETSVTVPSRWKGDVQIAFVRDRVAGGGSVTSEKKEKKKQSGSWNKRRVTQA